MKELARLRIFDSLTSQIVLRAHIMRGQFEDPATGSSCNTLAAYLTLIDGQAGQDHQYYAVRGAEMGRLSDLRVEVALS